MFDQLNSKGVPKNTKEIEIASNFYDFLSEELYMKKDQKNPFMFECHNLIDLME
jgi:hypothetical protein